jgi:Fe-S cluster assembly protein SufD
MNNSLTQYIDLYSSNRSTVHDNSPEVLNAPRAAALATVQSTPLPCKGDEGHIITDLNAMFAADLGVNITRIPFSADVTAAFKCDVPNISTLLGVVANDTFHAGEGMATRLPEGVTVCSFTEAAKTHADVLARHYNKIAPADNAAVALNTLLAQDGVFVHVARNVTCNKPIQLVNLLGGATTPLLAMRRMLIVVEQGAECTMLVCDHSRSSQVANVASEVIEIDIAPGGKLEYFDLEESSAETSRYCSLNARLDANSQLVLNVSTLRCGTTRNDISVWLQGEGADCRISGMSIADGTQRADNSASVYHNAPHCFSNQLFKYVVDDEALGGFEGIIRVADGAHHTEAYQNNRNVLAASTARMHTQPQLEIYCDDVKCSHGAATGQLDAKALFYMRSRGIPEAEARTMLMQAFMSDVIDTITLDPLRDRLRHLVERRLIGAHADCGECAAHTI